MDIFISSHLLLKNIPPDLEADLVGTFTLTNPKYAENQKMGRWNRGVPKHLTFYNRRNDNALIIPRGYLRQLIRQCRTQSIAYNLIDQRRLLTDIAFTFEGDLKPYQEKAVEAMAAKHFGTLSAPTGSGKTVMALKLIALRRQPVLIIVHTKDLAFQWIDKIGHFLNIDSEGVGLIGAGKKRWGRRITVALVQSLYKCADEAARRTGYLIVDECHRTPSRTFTDAVVAFDSQYMLGLSATPWRRDKLSQLIFWHLGDVRHHIQKEELVQSGDILPAEIILRETDFKPTCDPVYHYSKMLSELTLDEGRNHLLAADIAQEAQSGESGVCLVISDRKHHCQILHRILQKRFSLPSEIMTGDLSQVQRQSLIQRLNAGEIKILIATGQLIGEGFDAQGLKTLFIATPIQFGGRLIQYVGRVLRTAPGKNHARIYDYIDQHVPVLVKSAQTRNQIYGL